MSKSSAPAPARETVPLPGLHRPSTPHDLGTAKTVESDSCIDHAQTRNTEKWLDPCLMSRKEGLSSAFTLVSGGQVYRVALEGLCASIEARYPATHDSRRVAECKQKLDESQTIPGSADGAANPEQWKEMNSISFHWKQCYSYGEGVSLARSHSMYSGSGVQVKVGVGVVNGEKLGLRWIPNYVELEALLSEIIHGQGLMAHDQVEWTIEAKETFVKLKQALVSATTLGLPDPSCSFTQIVDERNGFMTSVLLQEHGGGGEYDPYDPDNQPDLDPKPDFLGDDLPHYSDSNEDGSTDFRKKMVGDALVNMVIKDSQPFSIVIVSREALLEIGKVRHELTFSLSDFNFLLRSHSTRSSQQGPAAPASGEQCSRRTEQPKYKRGKRGGLHARLKARATRPPLPSLLQANVRALENKLDELRTRITTQCEIKECCPLILTETWLLDSTPGSAIQLQMHSQSTAGTAQQRRGRTKAAVSTSM
ncbi:hypothetical protein AOLI_G00267280 [Acnodon oligacanthus]